MEIEIDSPRLVFARAGMRYLGEQEMARGRASEHVFDAPDGSTLMMPAPVTPETVAAKLAEHEEVVRRIKR